VTLADRLDAFFALAAPMPVTRPPTGTGASLLDQLPPLNLAVRGHAVTELLRPAYEAFTADPPP
jgi:hypothetical protein